MTQPNRINVLMILGSHWLEYEAAMAVDTFRQFNPSIPLYLAQPVASKLWPHPPRSTRVAEFEDLDAQVINFENLHFGARYPIGIKTKRSLPCQRARHLPFSTPIQYSPGPWT